jgi:hypothetical protein
MYKIIIKIIEMGIYIFFSFACVCFMFINDINYFFILIASISFLTGFTMIYF